jgi:hypothetical protein
VYENRSIRVQLREMNPSRSTQRFPRNRARPYRDYSGAFRSQFETLSNLSGDLHSESTVQLQDAHRRPLHFMAEHQRANGSSNGTEDLTHPTFPTIATTEVKPSLTDIAGEKFTGQEEFSYERPVSATSESLSSPSSVRPPTAIGPMSTYPVAVPPQSWMHTYPPYGYPLPYPGYMAYPPPIPSFQNSIPGDAATSLPYQWPAMAYAYRVSLVSLCSHFNLSIFHSASYSADSIPATHAVIW